MPASSSDTIARHRNTEREPARHRRSGGCRRVSDPAGGAPQALALYTDSSGHDREIVARTGSLGSVLVIDRDLATSADRRLLAHLAADEPPENAALICRDYLQSDPPDPARCRALTEQDARIDPLAPLGCDAAQITALASASMPRDREGHAYALRLVAGRVAIPELRWGCETADGAPAMRTLSLREVVGNLEHYEPACSLTEGMLALHKGDGEISTSVLEAELVRVRESPIVLNRRLREAVLAHVANERRSMSEIARLCGRVKRDRKGNESGETSWLARRVGLLAEGGRGAPTPWVHSDVLALIARRGLGLTPREVEVA
ncbi:MAG: hypothetical protein H0X28_02450 [Solirubrobacterales bacterium]|nr:hypothetical protein [Solirubrobacterales bacterium]